MVSLEDAAALLTTHHAATSNSAVGSVPDDIIINNGQNNANTIYVVCEATHDICCRKVRGSSQYKAFNIKYKQSES